VRVRDAAQVGSDDLDGPIAYAHLYYIAPEFRGTGASNTLQRYVDEFARRRNTRAIELNVEPGNTRAVRYYRRVGYRVARDPALGGSHVPHTQDDRVIERRSDMGLSRCLDWACLDRAAMGMTKVSPNGRAKWR
jgi:acetyltransferase (GNAT) family protein